MCYLQMCQPSIGKLTWDSAIRQGYAREEPLPSCNSQDDCFSTSLPKPCAVPPGHLSIHPSSFHSPPTQSPIYSSIYSIHQSSHLFTHPLPTPSLIPPIHHLLPSYSPYPSIRPSTQTSTTY